MPTQYKWSWCTVDKPGLWAFGGCDMEQRPKTIRIGLIETLPDGPTSTAWRCYIGPAPNIGHTPVKETMWFFQQSCGQPWGFIWMKDGWSENSEFLAGCHSKHCTTTTRYI